jgi:hypothetical protein
MCLDHCQAPDEWQHRQTMDKQAMAKAAAYRAGHIETPPIWTRPPFDLDRSVEAAKMQLSWHIHTLAEQAKDAMFWGVRL